MLVSVFSLTMGLVELQAGAIAVAIGRRWSVLGGYAANALCLNLAAIVRTRTMVAGSLAAVGQRGVCFCLRCMPWLPTQRLPKREAMPSASSGCVRRSRR